jgi:hypothetical protein
LIREVGKTNKGDRVAFSVSDSYLPPPEELRAAFPGMGEVDGTVMDFSDSGTVSSYFAVVRVVQERTVVVPIEKLRVMEEG